ncbi:MAG: hypothetical protein A6F71_02065 [Cycloclasticus sp. symbiont of Poecilosclerida sp. M]|nr:MAG: hypothetical protein A6F71_02065 [Cycloclasticus sp. symbiont of Poecilosclerida sp. M]
MSNSLLAEIDPFVCAEQKRYFSGQLSIKELPRLLEDVLASEALLDIEFQFFKEQKNIIITGRISGELMLQCAACLEPMSFPVDIQVGLAVIRDQSLMDYVPDSYEPCVVEDRCLQLSSIVEDEVLLTLPIIAKHDRCINDLPHTSASKDFVVEELEVKENPFEVLKNLKH